MFISQDDDSWMKLIAIVIGIVVLLCVGGFTVIVVYLAETGAWIWIANIGEGIIQPVLGVLVIGLSLSPFILLQWGWKKFWRRR